MICINTVQLLSNGHQMSILRSSILGFPSCELLLEPLIRMQGPLISQGVSATAARNSLGVSTNEMSLAVLHESTARRTLIFRRLSTTPTSCSRALETPYMVCLPLYKNDFLLAMSYIYLIYYSLVFMSHFDKLVHLPEGFVTIASTKNTEFAGIAHQLKPIFGSYFPLTLAS